MLIGVSIEEDYEGRISKLEEEVANLKRDSST